MLDFLSPEKNNKADWRALIVALSFLDEINHDSSDPDCNKNWRVPGQPQIMYGQEGNTENDKPEAQ